MGHTFILMGVAGVGKTTLGKAAAQALEFTFLEAEDLQTDDEKALCPAEPSSWIDRVVSTILEIDAPNIIVACSSLQLATRKQLRGGLNGEASFFHLHGDLVTLKRRLSSRTDKRVSSKALSQNFVMLEMPKRAVTIDIAQPIKDQLKIFTALIAEDQSKKT